MFCKKCGSEISDDSRFCSKCGASLSDASETRDVPVEVEKTGKPTVGGASLSDASETRAIPVEVEKTSKPTVGGSFGFAIIFEIVAQIILLVAGGSDSLDLPLGVSILLFVIETAIIAAVVHKFRKWKWESKH
ncbi:MAG: zinc-ribbon domain-containing protein [Spirochaetaceae bacterium]|nr:zinc-ribbon domain-containing protein [Spirochaetaceae bacterium]